MVSKDTLLALLQLQLLVRVGSAAD
eukprot:SAG31_NODE_19353_length_605_cov_0.677866_1_plen_24_part_01